MYFDLISKKTGKKIKDIFPNLKLLCHGGVNFKPYKSIIFESIGKTIDTLETYPASEGFFAFQNTIKDEGLLLAKLFETYLIISNTDDNKEIKKITNYPTHEIKNIRKNIL